MPWILLILFLLCNSGGFVTGAFGEIDIYEQCDWYLFPRNVKRMLPIIITICQKRTVVQGFGNILCTRETYARVIQKTFRGIKLYQSLTVISMLVSGRQQCLFLLCDAPQAFVININYGDHPIMSLYQSLYQK